MIDQTQLLKLCPSQKKIDEINIIFNNNQLDPDTKWEKLVEKVLTTKENFPLHEFLFESLKNDQPLAVWTPRSNEITNTNIYKFMKRLGLKTYPELVNYSNGPIASRANFWMECFKELKVIFKTPPSTPLMISEKGTNFKWPATTTFNIVDSCFKAEDSKAAILFKKNNNELGQWTYKELKSFTNRISNSLLKLGLKAGDSVAIDMPMNKESVGIYLGIIQANLVAVSIADSFASSEIETRLRISKAKLIFTQDFIIRGNKELPLYQKVKEAGDTRAVVFSGIGNRLKTPLRKNDLDFETFLSFNEQFDTRAAKPNDHTNILFSSGTTGEPKAIPWTHTTPIKAAMDGYFHQDIKEADVVCWPTNLGWMMGPWLIYATFINNATMALYEDAPTTSEFGEFIEKAKVSVLGLVPSIVKAWKISKCMEKFSFKYIKCFSSTGECSNSKDSFYLSYLGNYRPVIEYCGGTEIGGGYITGSLVQKQSPSTFSTVALGIDLVILDENFKEVSEGEVFLIPPSIGLSESLLNRDHDEAYFKGLPLGPNNRILRRHGDQLLRLENGYFRAQGRADDTMNLGGIKTSSADIERVLNSLSEIHESAAIAVSPKDGGPSLLVACVVLKEKDSILKGPLLKKMGQVIKENLNPLFKLEDIAIMESLPRTASNKVMRRLLRDQVSKNF